MPLYDYQCKSCGLVFEVEHGINEDPQRVQSDLECPNCGDESNGFKRLITGSSFALKGSGWSRDGYR